MREKARERTGVFASDTVNSDCSTKEDQEQSKEKEDLIRKNIKKMEVIEEDTLMGEPSMRKITEENQDPGKGKVTQADDNGEPTQGHQDTNDVAEKGDTVFFLSKREILL